MRPFGYYTLKKYVDSYSVAIKINVNSNYLIQIEHVLNMLPLSEVYHTYTWLELHRWLHSLQPIWAMNFCTVMPALQNMSTGGAKIVASKERSFKMIFFLLIQTAESVRNSILKKRITGLYFFYVFISLFLWLIHTKRTCQSNCDKPFWLLYS